MIVRLVNGPNSSHTRGTYRFTTLLLLAVRELGIHKFRRTYVGFTGVMSANWQQLIA